LTEEYNDVSQTNQGRGNRKAGNRKGMERGKGEILSIGIEGYSIQRRREGW
jgi:hypothetical protein